MPQQAGMHGATARHAVPWPLLQKRALNGGSVTASALSAQLRGPSFEPFVEANPCLLHGGRKRKACRVRALFSFVQLCSTLFSFVHVRKRRTLRLEL